MAADEAAVRRACEVMLSAVSGMTYAEGLTALLSAIEFLVRGLPTDEQQPARGRLAEVLTGAGDLPTSLADGALQ